MGDDDGEALADIARAAAGRLAGEVDGRLPVAVERRLYDGDATRGAEQYVDLVSVAELVVSFASLALAAYQHVRRHTDAPAAEVIERRVRIEASELAGTAALSPAQRDRIVTVVVEETIRRSQSAGD